MDVGDRPVAAPVLGPGVALFAAELNLRLTAARALPVYGQIADFTLTNQNGAVLSLADLRGHVWVADIIFTRCAGPCPR